MGLKEKALNKMTKKAMENMISPKAVGRLTEILESIHGHQEILVREQIRTRLILEDKEAHNAKSDKERKDKTEAIIRYYQKSM